MRGNIAKHMAKVKTRHDMGMALSLTEKSERKTKTVAQYWKVISTSNAQRKVAGSKAASSRRLDRKNEEDSEDVEENVRLSSCLLFLRTRKPSAPSRRVKRVLQ